MGGIVVGRRGRRPGWMAVGAAVVLAGALLAGVEPAAASHAIDWGAGRACGQTSRTATTTVDTPVAFIVCVTLGGEPLPGHELQVTVQGPTRQVETSVRTGDDGIARFSVQPTAAGDTRVTLCDADGCLYGETVITASPATTTTTATTAVVPAPAATEVPVPSTTTTEPSATTTTAATSAATSTTASRTTTAEDGQDASSQSSGGFPVWLVPAGLLVLILIGLVSLLRRRFAAPIAMVPSPTPGGPVFDEGAPPIHVTPPVHGRVRPIIFVPGIMASALRIRNAAGNLERVWPPLGFGGDVRTCLESLQVRQAGEFEIDSSSGDGLLDAIHKDLILTLNGHGYQNLGTKPNLYIYPYNWMQSCEGAGAGLAELIRRAESDHGVAPGIIAHSMGGLVVRSAWHLHGARSVDRVMYIGSPHLGASMAYFVLHPEIEYSFLGGTGGDVLNAAYAMSVVANHRGTPVSTPEQLASFVTNYFDDSKAFDSTLKMLAENASGVFELLPDELYFQHVHPQFNVARRLEATKLTTFPEGRDLPDFVWLGTGRGDDPQTVAQPVRYTRIPRTWNELYLQDPEMRLPPTMHQKVEQAMAFKRRISGPLPPENPGLTMIIHGSTQPTNSTADFHVDDDGEIHVVLSGAQGGDGTVPRLSGRGEPLWAGAPTVVLENSEEHFRLTEAAPVHVLVRQFFPPGGA